MMKTENNEEVIYTLGNTIITIKKDDDFLNIHQITSALEAQQTWQDIVNYLDTKL